AEEQLHEAQDVSAQLEKAGADVIVWSETSFPYLVPRWAENENQLRGVRSRFDGDAWKPRFRVPLVFGALTYDAEGHWKTAMLPDRYPYNSVIYMDAKGRVRCRSHNNYIDLLS